MTTTVRPLSSPATRQTLGDIALCLCVARIAQVKGRYRLASESILRALEPFKGEASFVLDMRARARDLAAMPDEPWALSDDDVADLARLAVDREAYAPEADD